jgi:hypothetical protein
MEDGPQNINFNIVKTKYIQKESLLSKIKLKGLKEV